MIVEFLHKVFAGLTALVIAISGALSSGPREVSYPEPLIETNLIEIQERVLDYQKQVNVLELMLEKLKAGATIPVTVALFETTLAAKISSSATSMTLTTGTDKAGDDLSGYICYVISEGETNEEFVCGTTAGTAVTSMIRGIDPIDGDAEITALKKAHRRGSSVKVSNYPQLAIVSRILNGTETVPNKLTYANAQSFTADQNLISKKYADDLAIAGAPDATFTVKGILEAATNAELALGTTSGSTDALLVPTNQFFGETSSAAKMVPVTGSDGKLGQGFFDLTEGWTWSGKGIFDTGGLMTDSFWMDGTANFTGSSITFSSDYPTLPGSSPSVATDTASKGYVDDNFCALTGNQTIAGIKTFSSFPITPSAAPTTDYQVSNKKYVDDQITANLSKISIVTTDVTVTNTDTETNLISVSIPANTLGTANGVKAKIFISDFDSATTSSVIIALKYGSTTLVTMDIATITNPTTSASGYIDVLLLATGATNSQEGSIGTSLSTTAQGTNNLVLFDTGSGTATEDSTGALNLTVTWKRDNVNAGDSVTMSHAIIEAIQ